MYYCGQLGTYILFITNYVKYNKYFNESSFTKLITHFPVQYQLCVKMMTSHSLKSYLYYIPMCTTGDEMSKQHQI